MKLTEATRICRGGGHLPLESVPELVRALLDPAEANDPKKQFLLALSKKGETAAELAAFASAILPMARDPGIQGVWNGKPLLDCCGTGGGGLNMINFSTAMMFVLAGAGVPVVKHGNRGLTKTSGSADALESLGLEIDLSPDRVRACLEKTNMAFIFAPAYHVTFRVIAPVRKEIAAEGQRTIFNLLGPLLNPARPSTQLTGVFRQPHLELFSEALAKLGRTSFRVLYGESAEGMPLGEASPAGTTCWRDHFGNLSKDQRQFSPSSSQDWQSLWVSSARESADHIVALLKNQAAPLAREMLLVNTAHALCAHGTAASLEEGLAQARESLDSGAAQSRLKEWQSL